MKFILASFTAAGIIALSASSSWANTVEGDCGNLNLGGTCTILSGGTDAAGSAAGSFGQEWTFQLSDSTNITATALTSAEDRTASTYITGWQAYFYTNVGTILAPVLGTEVAGPGTETDITGPPPDNTAQGLNLSATLLADSSLPAGTDGYIVLYTGTGGGSADFAGNLKAVGNNNELGAPGPIVGAGLPGLVFAIGGFLAWRRRPRQTGADLASA